MKLTDEMVAGVKAQIAKHSRVVGDCIEWTGTKHEKGYGLLTAFKRSWRVHRLVYALQYGEVPDGLCVLHRCDNPSCIAAAHLFLGTKAVNNDDMIAKGRLCPPPPLDGAANPQAKLAKPRAREIRYEFRKVVRDTIARLAKENGVSAETIVAVASGRRYRWLVLDDDLPRPALEPDPVPPLAGPGNGEAGDNAQDGPGAPRAGKLSRSGAGGDNGASCSARGDETPPVPSSINVFDCEARFEHDPVCPGPEVFDPVSKGRFCGLHAQIPEGHRREMHRLHGHRNRPLAPIAKVA